MPIIKLDYIKDKLSYIQSKINNDTKLQHYDINKKAEDIFMHLLNLTYGWNLQNANGEVINFPAIDLIDTTKNNEIVIQVTSDTKKKKVKEDTVDAFNTLVKKDKYKIYAHYEIKMFYIKDKPSKSTLKNWEDEGLISQSNILGIEDINKKISADTTHTLATKVYRYLCNYFHDKACDSDISPQLTTKLGKSTLIGREKELQEIDERLKASNTLLVKGIGGVGKSTIASNYLHRHKDEYDYYGFFEGLESFERELEGAFKLEIEQGKDRLDRVLRELIKLEPTSNKLLVIDNVKEIKENQKKLDKILELEHNGYRVLLTSREEIEDVAQYDLDVLSMDDAKKLFNSIYEVEDEVLLEEILEYLDCHAFFIDKTAHSIKKTLTPQMIRDKFKNGEFSKISVKRKENFNKFLNEIFTLDGLDNEEISMLKQFSVLPSIEIEFDFLQMILDKKDDEEFEDLLNYLCEKGWLSSFENRYKLHQIIKEYILENQTPKIIDIKSIYNFCHLLISDVMAKNFSKDEYDFLYLESLILFLKRISYKEEDLLFFLNGLGVTYHKLGFYKKSLEVFKNAMKMNEEIFSNGYTCTSDIYGNLGSIYERLGEYELAYFYFKKALKITSKKFGLKSKSSQIHIVNIAFLYHSEQKYEKALPLYLKLLKLDSENPHLLTMLGELYNQIKKYEKALSYTKKAVILKEKKFGKEHISTAICYNNYAKTLMGLKNYSKAMSYFKMSLKINEKQLGEHLETATNYNNIALVYEAKKNYKKAIRFHEKALEIRIKLLHPYHPETALYYFNIGALYAFLKNEEKAFEIFHSYLKAMDKVSNKDYRDLFITYHFLAVMYERSQDIQLAYSYCKQAVKAGEIVFEKDDPQLIYEKKALLVLKEKLLEECLWDMKPIFL